MWVFFMSAMTLNYRIHALNENFTVSDTEIKTRRRSIMNRDFLKGLGIADEDVEKIMAEHGKSLKADKGLQEDYEALKNEKHSLEQTISALNDEKNELSNKYSELETERDNLSNDFSVLKNKELKRTIAIRHNLPIDLSDRLVGDDEETLSKDAENLASFMTINNNVAPLKESEQAQSDEDSAYRNLLSAFDTEE